MAVAPTFHDVIISFPNDAPSSLLEEAKEKVRNTKGAKITHEYSTLGLRHARASDRLTDAAAIINAFAAHVPDNMFSDIQAMSTEYPPVIEGDGIVTTQDDNKVKIGL